MRYEIRAMSFAEMLDTGFRLVRDHFVLLVGSALVLYLPLALLGAWLSDDLQAAAASPDAVLQAGGVVLGVAVVGMLLSPIVNAAITYAISEVFLGRGASIGGCLRTSLSILAPLLGTFSLATLAIAAGAVLLIIPGLYLMLAFLLVNQVVVIERRFGAGALRRSRELMRGHMLRGAGILLVTGLLVIVLQVGMDFVLSPLPLIHPLGTGIAQAVGFAFSSSVAVLLYFDIRCRKEAFDLEHLSRVVEETGRTPSPSTV